MDTVISTSLSTETSFRIAAKKNIYGSSSFIGNGTSYLFYTFGTPMSNTNYIVQITPTQQPTNPGTIGEYYIIKTINDVSIINTGIAQTTFDYTITY